MHPLLRRQLRRLGLAEDSAPSGDQWCAFLDRVSRTYAEADQDRYTIERSLKTSSQEMQHLHDELRRAEASLKALVPLAITLFDPASLRILEVNDTAVRLYGYSREELLAKTMADIKVPEELPELIERMAAVRQETVGPGDAPVPLRGMRAYLKKDGTRIQVETIAHPVLLEGRRVMLVIGNDVTEARRLEERVRQAQKMDAIGNLAGGVAHDFNNLLSIILSYCDLAVTDLAHDDPIRTDLAEIKGAGRRAADLTRQLLTFSRQQVIRPTIEDLNDVLAKLEKMLRRLIGEDVELTVLPAPGLARVEIDAGQIEQVIMNLVVNARDAMPHGGRLTIGTADVLLSESDAASQVGVSPGPYVMMAIGDTGTGMNKATQARMFEPFFTTKETGKGTGLGLATVFGIVRRSGGTIWVDSEPGKGTKMKVYFPAVARGRVVRASSSPPAPISLRGFETILLVEDEEPVRVLARTILRKYGYNVLEAQGGGDAVLLAEEAGAPIHLLLTDVVMPRLSGPRLAERLVAVRPDMRVLYMSGYLDDAVLRHGIVDATVAFIQKPITPETLARKVREVLDGDRPT